MDKKNREEMVGVVAEALDKVIVPALDKMAEEIKQDIKKDLGAKIDSLDRKFDAQQERLDRHDKRITKLEKKAHFVSP